MKQKLLIDSQSNSIVTLVLPFNRWWTSEEEGEEVAFERGGEVREGWSCKRSRIRNRSRIRQRSRSWLRSRIRKRVGGGVDLGLQQEEEEEVEELRRGQKELLPGQAVMSD